MATLAEMMIEVINKKGIAGGKARISKGVDAEVAERDELLIMRESQLKMPLVIVGEAPATPKQPTIDEIYGYVPGRYTGD